MNKQAYDLVFNSFVDAPAPRLNRVPHRISFGGNFVKLESGKHTWAELGHAKTALRNHVEQVLYRTRTYTSKKAADEIIAQLIKDGLEFVPFEQ